VATFQEIIDPARLGFDPEALRLKYREERDKRLRADGNEQYREVVGDFAHYVDDPYAPRIERPPVTDEIEVAIIGGGFGGLLVGARLREIGVESLRVIEKGGDFGGTWYWNRYPGAMCDIESYIYLPLLEEMGYVPSEKYAHAPEILDYSKKIAERYRLYEGALLQTIVTGMRWDADARRWIVTTDRGDTIRARFVAMSNGLLDRPKLPGIPGIETYTGHTFHTSRWDYAYTGGDSNGDLWKLRDKRVAIIGTGATAVQAVPHLGETAKHLYVFQRTPSSIDVRNNRPTDRQWARSLGAGWQARRMDNFTNLVSGGDEEEDHVGDGWTDTYRKLTAVKPAPGSEHLSKAERAIATEMLDFEKMQSIRARVDEIVRDRETAEALKPYYRQFCKRPCFHDDYLETFNRSNVTLVDTDGKGVERITPRGIVVAGVEYEVDCIIFATGFEVGTSYTRRSGYDIVGRGGVTLSQQWADGAVTLHGLHSVGFPNCFFMGMTQSVISPNFVHLLNEQAKHVAYVMRNAREQGWTNIEVTPEAQAEWCETIVRLARAGERFFAECTPGYYNNEGKPSRRTSFTGNSYGGGPAEFFKVLERWRDAGGLVGLARS
jgi:cyclohexanone monooxygenase